MDSEMTPVSRTTSAASTISSSQATTSTRAQRRGSRTTNACEACKKRKTKCSGPPSVCEACQKVDTFCHFNLRLDTRRKLAYKPRIVRERQQYILEGILQILKHNDNNAVQKFVKLIRSEARPQEIAHCLKGNLHNLQSRGLIPALEVDETDLVSLGLQSLFSHRAGRNIAKTNDETTSPTLSERSDVRSAFPGTVRSSFGNNPTTTEGFQASFGHINVDSSPQADEHFGGDSLSDGSTDLAYEQNFAKVFSSTTPHSTSTFGSGAGTTLASTTRPVLHTRGPQYPGYWRIASPMSLQNNGSYQVPDLRMYNSRTTMDRTAIDFKELSQRVPAPNIPTGELANNGEIECDLLFRERTSHDHWNIPNWANEVRSTMS